MGTYRVSYIKAMYPRRRWQPDRQRYTPRRAGQSSSQESWDTNFRQHQWRCCSDRTITLISCVIFIRYKIVYYRRHSSLSSFAKVCFSSLNTHQVGTSLNYRVPHPRNHSPSNPFIAYTYFQHLLQMLPYQCNARPHSCTWILKVPLSTHTSISPAIMDHSHSRLQIKSETMQATLSNQIEILQSTGFYYLRPLL